ncbi:unnamed protein product [Medioppia subpectinata]|uniref:Broad-complex n=1 Tax=Medioppia subpectinata TaxID=1979941 RepID=A0A7R9Q5W5_9ACAR|nr:unnamed protein product [Medioppia subpectinata]CAG2112667.1 unnamed protein product [Medioppia subpectinata]
MSSSSSSETSQAFCLRLNNHKRFITGALAQLYSTECLVDVTLSAGGQQLRAHRVVLAACSPYFKSLFDDCPHKTDTNHPIIIIKGVPFADLKAIVEFIYRGEVCVPRRQLRSILANGAELQIKGLHEFDKNNWSESTGAAIDDNDDHNGVEEEEEEKEGEDNDESIADNNSKQVIKSMGKKCLKACESNESTGNGKGTRKKGRAATTRTKRTDTNGQKRTNYGRIVSAMQTQLTNDNTNDEMVYNDMTALEDDITDDDEKDVNMNTNNNNTNHSNNNKKCEASIASLMNSNSNGNEKHKSMTANGVPPISTDSVVPIQLLQQSVMIDVKHNVNINANQPSEESSDSSASTGPVNSDVNTSPFPSYLNCEPINKKAHQFNDKQHTYETNKVTDTTDEPLNAAFNLQSNTNLPVIQAMNESSIDRSSDTIEETNDKSLITVIKTEPKVKKSKTTSPRVSKAGIPRKGTASRSQKKVKCPVCQKVYVSPQNMREHLRNTHTNPDQKYVCSVCLREYSWKHALDRHFKSKHSKEK